MSTGTIVQYCAPTLAGLKAGNLFSHQTEAQEDLTGTIEMLNELLEEKGVHFEVMKRCRGITLIYAYRKNQLEAILCDREVQAFLRDYGYADFRIEACLERLRERLMQEDFPHDIGVFLDYPLADIKAFITNKGCNCPCSGCWKAYTNVNEAEKKFQSFKLCTELYCQYHDAGVGISQLTVAG